ncbi:hypothetical protein ACKWTF_004192 [Chironomus riparius]
MKISTSEGTARRIRIRHKEISLSTHKKKYFGFIYCAILSKSGKREFSPIAIAFMGEMGGDIFYLKKIYIYTAQQSEKKMLCFILIENEIFVYFAFIVFLLLCAMHKCLYTTTTTIKSSKQISSMNVR